MKILILGAKGMLSHDLMACFSDYQPIGWDIDEIDITNQDEVMQKISQQQPEIVINAAAYTDVDGAEKNRDLAKKVNAEAVGYLAAVCQKIRAVLIHYSTDYVFRGDKKQGYKETNQATYPLNFYGQSKLLGEQKLLSYKLQVTSGFYLIRTAWLFGPWANPGQHKNFVETVLKLAQEKDEIKVVDDQFGSPTYTYDLALATKNLLENKYPFGIYHLTNSGVTNWFGFAREIIKLAGLKTKISPCSTNEFPRLAKRPRYSILLNTKFPLLRSWQEALKDYIKVKNQR